MNENTVPSVRKAFTRKNRPQGGRAASSILPMFMRFRDAESWRLEFYAAVVGCGIDDMEEGACAHMANILVVDDDKAILTMIRRILEKDGYNVTTVSDSIKAGEMKTDLFDLIILDVMMPEKDGFTLCGELRGIVDCPILFLTARSEESSLVQGLCAGADDYISKPFGAAELRARVAAHLRRERREHFAGLVFAGSRFQLSARQLVVQGEEIPLTKAEYSICEFLARNHGQVFSKEQIYEAVFGFDGESNDTTITTHIKNIRMKLEKYQYAPIKTVWGIGYKWED